MFCSFNFPFLRSAHAPPTSNPTYQWRAPLSLHRPPSPPSPPWSNLLQPASLLAYLPASLLAYLPACLPVCLLASLPAGLPACFPRTPHTPPSPPPCCGRQPLLLLAPEVDVKCATGLPRGETFRARDPPGGTPRRYAMPPKHIKFKDAVGRRFTLPFEAVKTWKVSKIAAQRRTACADVSPEI